MSATAAINPPRKNMHRRNKSASVLSSILSTKSQKRATHESARPDQYPPRLNGVNASDILPLDHSHTAQRSLSEIEHPGDISGRKGKPSEEKPSRPKGLHSRTLSSISLRSLGKEKGKAGDSREQSSIKSPKSVKASEQSAKKKKSSTSLAAMFGKSKQRTDRDISDDNIAGKENTSPPSSAGDSSHAPIWAEFRSQSYQEITSVSNVPLNDHQRLKEEVALYTPRKYSPTKERNFFGIGTPTLQKKGKSASNSTQIQDQTKALRNCGSNLVATQPDVRSPVDRKNGSNYHTDPLQHANSTSRVINPEQKRMSRVLAAATVLDGGAQKDQALKCQESTRVEFEFEAMLDARNIPEHMRAGMRSLTIDIKADLISKNKIKGDQKEKTSSSKFSKMAQTFTRHMQPAKMPVTTHDEDQMETYVNGVGPDSPNANKRGRPRSRTFTLSKAGSPSKKQKPDGRPFSTRSNKSIDIPKSPSTRSLIPDSVSRDPSTSSKNRRKAQDTLPSEFVTYLRKFQKPEEVEVGKLHKLRILLRNETVAWVDSFIEQGGMTETVSLLQRIMDIEWREEHEDSLLHENLLCLKGLCTTDRALRELSVIAPKLFPALLGMLFDGEHKGPSEFTTRGIIMCLLFAHLSSASNIELPKRARSVLSYLKDPLPKEDAQPLPFIMEMQQPRPYRVWCREISNVTKEVFWIFLHNLNVVPLPSASDGIKDKEGEIPSSDSKKSALQASREGFAANYFPGLRPPVPAAPYVGGVEWDATNYIATHLDLMNALIASLPTESERNALRSDLRASSMEKVMGNALRLCKEKFYGHVHDGLKLWVAAAVADSWEVKNVRMGFGDESSPVKSANKSPNKKSGEKPPMIDVPRMELPKLGLGLDLGPNSPMQINGMNDDWI